MRQTQKGKIDFVGDMVSKAPNCFGIQSGSHAFAVNDFFRNSLISKVLILCARIFPLPPGKLFSLKVSCLSNWKRNNKNYTTVIQFQSDASKS
jgi:hypothetical protein